MIRTLKKQFLIPVKPLTHQTRGVSEARNFEVERSLGSTFAFLDADDEWLSVYLNTKTRLIENYPEAGAFAAANKSVTVKKVHIKTKQFTDMISN